MNNFKIYDRENNLYLIHYTHDNGETANGFILDGRTFEIVCRNIPMIEEVYIYDNNNINIENYRFFEAIEGTNLRLFYYENRWRISTTKKINACTSFWGDSNVSFGCLFYKAIVNFLSSTKKNLNYFEWLETLNKNYQYIFRITPTMNTRKISKYTQIPNVYHVGTFIGKYFYPDNNDNIIPPLKEYNFNNFEQLEDFVLTSNPLEREGIIMYNKLDNKFTKVISDRFSMLSNIRGQVCDIELRYLQIRKDFSKIILFKNLYRERENQFRKIENGIKQLTKIIHSVYMKIYVKKINDYKINKDFIKVVKRCHSRYVKTKEKTTKEIVYNILCNLNSKFLLRMVRKIY